MKTSSLAATRGAPQKFHTQSCVFIWPVWQLLRKFHSQGLSLFNWTQYKVFSPGCFSEPNSGNCLTSQKPFMKLTKSLRGKGGNLEAELCTCLRQTSDGPKSHLWLTLRFCAKKKWRLKQNCKLPVRMLKPCSKAHRETNSFGKDWKTYWHLRISLFIKWTLS